MLLFIVCSAALLAVTLLLLCAPALRRGARASVAPQAQTYRETALAVNADRSAQLDAAEAAGELDADALRGARVEAQRTLLDALDAAERLTSERPASNARLPALLASVVVALASLGLYARFGNVDAIDAPMAVAAGADARSSETEAAAQTELRRSTEALAARLANDADDVAGWSLLARSRVALGEYETALPAFARAHSLTPEGETDPALLVDHAEALALLSGQVTGSGALPLIERALAVEPEQPKALWLDGLGALEAGKRERALQRFRALLPRMQPGSPQHGALTRLLAQLETGVDPEVGVDASANARPAAGADPSVGDVEVEVRVRLDPALAGAVPEGALLFVFARDAAADPGQPSPPLAAVRVESPNFPARVTLDNSVAMIAGRDIGSVSRVRVVARLSASGNPTVSSGDLEGASAAFDPREQVSVEVLIDTQAP